MDNCRDMKFSASVIQGSGRGKKIGVPTLNLNLEDVPGELSEGIYACNVGYELPIRKTPIQPSQGLRQGPRQAPFRQAMSYRLAAVMHYGPRPVFRDIPSCEVHLLDGVLPSPPTTITVEVFQRLRDVQDFPSEDALKKQMRKDIKEAREILAQ